MKNLLIFACFVLFSCKAHTQLPAPTEAIYAMPTGKKAVLKLPFGENIIVTTWNQPSLQFKSVITTDNDAFKQIHTATITDNKDSLFIETGFAKTFQNKEVHCFSCDSLHRWEQDSSPGDCICLKVSYEITVPAGASLSIETISGDIEVKGHNGELHAKTISGFVDVDRQSNASANLDFHSVTGEIYTDFDLHLEGESNAWSKGVDMTLGKGGPSLAVESVSGNIFFRKR